MADTQSEQIDQQIVDSATGPKRAQGDTGSVERYSLSEQIAAANYFASKRATRSRGLGIRMSRLSPPGARDMS